MSTSRYIARLMGPVLLALGLGMLIENDTTRALFNEFLSNRALIYLAGILTLVAGLAIVNAHNDWVDDWRLIITVLGWLAIVGGLIRILLPGKVQALGAGLTGNVPAMIVCGLVVFVLGAVLAYNGYEHLWRGAQRRQAAASTRSAKGTRKPRRGRRRA